MDTEDKEEESKPTKPAKPLNQETSTKRCQFHDSNDDRVLHFEDENEAESGGRADRS